MATDRLGSILAFVRVAESGSFAKAAKALGVSSSAVSKSVARLEERLETRLFQRTTRTLTLTEEGNLFFHRCEKVLSELDDAERSMRDRADNPAGILKVGLPAALGRCGQAGDPVSGAGPEAGRRRDGAGRQGGERLRSAGRDHAGEVHGEVRHTADGERPRARHRRGGARRDRT